MLIGTNSMRSSLELPGTIILHLINSSMLCKNRCFDSPFENALSTVKWNLNKTYLSRPGKQRRYDSPDNMEIRHFYHR